MNITAGWYSLLILMMVAVGVSAGGEKKFELVERSVPGELRSVKVRDMDGDGIQDLVYVAVEKGTREVGFFRGRAVGGIEKTPTHRLQLKPDVILFALGDLDPAPGVEFVLFNHTSVFVYRHAVVEERKRYRRLFRESFFFSFPDPERVPLWPCVLDLNGDGLDDICVPVWGGYVLRLQTRPDQGPSSFDRRHLISVWIDQGSGAASGPEGGRRINVSIGFGGDKVESGGGGSPMPPVGGFMVESIRRMSSPVIVDENGDGRMDLILLEGQRLKIWRQDGKGVFSGAPEVSEDISRVLALAPKWSQNGNLLHADLDGDGKLDFLVRQGVKNTLRTRLLLFMGGVSSVHASPRRIFVLNGLTATPRFRDVDGDGRLDLLVPTFRLDLLKRARRAAIQSLDITLHVFLNRKKKGFKPRPDYSRTETLRTDRLAVAGVEPMVYLDGDFNRDRRADLLILDEDETLKIFLSAETRGGFFSSGGDFTFQDRPAVSVPVKVPRSIQLCDLEEDGVSEVLMLYDRGFSLGGWGVGKGRGR